MLQVHLLQHRRLRLQDTLGNGLFFFLTSMFWHFAKRNSCNEYLAVYVYKLWSCRWKMLSLIVYVSKRKCMFFSLHVLEAKQKAKDNKEMLKGPIQVRLKGQLGRICQWMPTKKSPYQVAASCSQQRIDIGWKRGDELHHRSLSHLSHCLRQQKLLIVSCITATFSNMLL